MKKVGFLAASVAAASATAVSVSSSSSYKCSSNFQFSRQEKVSDNRDQEIEHSPSTGTSSTNSFEPRFDGLRFIETLVTAHR